jgi:LysM domain
MNAMPRFLAVTPALAVQRAAPSLANKALRCAGLVAGCMVTAVSAQAQNTPVTVQQRTTAQQVAQTGVPLSELASNAPERHTVVRGDTLWAISGLFLRSPWRWPELWGMNLNDIRNPHRIYPGQVLVLDTSSGRALLRVAGAESGGELPTVRVSPRTRHESLTESVIPPVSLQAIEPFLTEAVVVNEAEFALAPRLVAAQEGRVLLSRGDRAYARSLAGADGDSALSMARGQPRQFRVFRSATPLKDPTTGEVLGFEAQYVGRVQLVRGEQLNQVPGKDGKPEAEIVPATVDITATKEEMRTGDRLLPEPPRDLSLFVPRAPEQDQSGQIVSVYGSAVTYAGQNQVVAINRGTQHGMAPGHVLAVLKDGQRLQDRTDDQRATIRLPSERNGLMVVFRSFERLSYGLVLQISDGVKVGDRFTNP